MKYLVLGPASMAIYSLVGNLKAHESQLAEVEEISGSSAGSILTLFLALGMSIDEILDISLNTNISKLVKLDLCQWHLFVKNWWTYVDVIPHLTI
jgi:NTE family protein